MTMPARVAVVTGAASGIGRAIALRLARDGMNVAVLDLDREKAASVAVTIRDTGGSALDLRADVARAADVVRAAESVRAVLGPVHVLVNNAGICEFVPFAHMTEAQWVKTLEVNLSSMFHCTRAFLDDMMAAGWGRIVNVSSVAGLTGGGPSLAHYAASKAGVVGLTKALAQELGPAGITVNAIAPGLIDTPLLRKSQMPEALIEQIVQRLPVRRLGQPEDIAAACAYLVSEEAGFVSGQVLCPNGGAH